MYIWRGIAVRVFLPIGLLGVVKGGEEKTELSAGAVILGEHLNYRIPFYKEFPTIAKSAEKSRGLGLLS